ncbi:hypothetical protein [Paracoccus sp. NSM]|uniref:hypothetical protein n=1 Tax=Paracoccus sp. NSM TaxID=3457784 RepID=UPI004035E8EA
MAGADSITPDGRPMILHLGVQKTGTTSLQRFLRLNAPALADRLMIRTPEEGTPMRPLGRAAIRLSLAPGDDNERATRVAFEDVLDTLPDGPQTALISHENLAGAMPGNGGETRLYPALPRIAQLLDKVAQERGFAPVFAICTRNMAAWKPSVWAQAVRTDGYAGDLDQFQRETADLPGWGDLFRRMGAKLGADRVHRLRLEDETDPDRPATQLLRLAGLDAARIAALPPLDGRAMERLSNGSTEFLRRINGLALNPTARDKVADLVARSQTLFAADWPSKGTS